MGQQTTLVARDLALAPPNCSNQARLAELMTRLVLQVLTPLFGYLQQFCKLPAQPPLPPPQYPLGTTSQHPRISPRVRQPPPNPAHQLQHLRRHPPPCTLSTISPPSTLLLLLLSPPSPFAPCPRLHRHPLQHLSDTATPLATCTNSRHLASTSSPMKAANSVTVLSAMAVAAPAQHDTPLHHCQTLCAPAVAPWNVPQLSTGLCPASLTPPSSRKWLTRHMVVTSQLLAFLRQNGGRPAQLRHFSQLYCRW